MPPSDHLRSQIVISICITTFNRADYIGETLKSILVQLTNDCEVVVLDGGSTDDTERVVLECAQQFSGLRYVRGHANRGFDHDCDSVIELARGEYCWLMTDDDVLKSGALSKVLCALRQEPSLLIVNVESRDLAMCKLLQRRWLELESDRLYRSEEMDRLFEDVSGVVKYVGCFVIKREIWLSRERKRYFGTMFVNLGVIFQERLPGDTLVIAEPLISYRLGNVHTFSPKMFETFMVKLPLLVWSLALSDAAKRKLCLPEPWRDNYELLLWRGLGFYSLVEYRRWVRPRLRSGIEALAPVCVALMPGILVNALFIYYYSMIRRPHRGVHPDAWLDALKSSRFSLWNARSLKRKSACLSHSHTH